MVIDVWFVNRILKILAILIILFYGLGTGFSAYGQKESFKVNLDRIKQSQVDTIVLRDTILVRSETITLLNDSIGKKVIIVIDTSRIYTQIIDTIFDKKELVILKADTIYGINERVFRGIYKYSKRKNIVAKLVGGLFSYQPGGVESSSKPDKVEISTLLSVEDKVIRSIKIEVLEPLGYSISNTSKKPHSVLAKTGNFLHVKSKRRLIGGLLLFKVGDKVDATAFSETERIIRMNDYIYDARIMILDSSQSDSVDVMVYAQDVFSLGVGASADVKNNFYRFIGKDLNMFGLGQMLLYDVRFGNKYSGKVNQYGSYRINNLFRTFATSTLYFNLENGHSNYGVQLNRDFVTPLLKWIGGVNYEWNKFPYKSNIEVLPQHFSDTLTFFRYDYWVGLPTKLLVNNAAYQKGHRLIFALRYFNTQYSIRPDEYTYKDSAFIYPYYNSNFFLGNITFFKRENIKDKYVFRFGRTEDIPDGMLVSGLVGLHLSSRANRPYYGINYSYSRNHLTRGYLFCNIGLGSFFNASKMENAILNLRTMIYSPLLPVKKYRVRQFFAFRYTHGHNMIMGNTIDINNEKGVRGFSSFALKGTEKIILNTETDIFLPYNILGFKFAAMIFADFAWITSDKRIFSKNNFYPAVGVGLKIRNEHLNFDSFQLFFGYYPNSGSAEARDFLFFQRSYSFYTFNNFYYSRPEVIPFY
jgi:hypothetical protein